mmetsp:Transcript_54644/g.144393  ORF Transcript_54644/g.144393 Transcript_54644/m.144393 type:complete len:206 (-) Transcript_54644:558-1175(-)
MSGRTLVMMVGPTKLPLGYLSTLRLVPSSTTSAPSARADCTISRTRATEAGEMRGPRSAPASQPADTLSFLARSTMPGIQSRASPTSTATLRAMQRWPAAPKAAPARASRARSREASGSTQAWFLAAMLHCARLPLALARLKMCSPATLEPTKETVLISGWSQMKLTVSWPPWMRFTVPGGKPACAASSMSLIEVKGTLSDGFIT